MANVNVTIRMDEQLKLEAEELFGDFGLSLSSAFTMFAKQAFREQRIPFEVKRAASKPGPLPDVLVETISKKLIEENREAYTELAK